MRQITPIQRNRSFLPADFELSTWESVLPYFTKLSEQHIASLNDLQAFCASRSELESYLSENFAWRYIKMSCDNQNSELQASYQQFVNEIMPNASVFDDEWNKKVIDSGFVDQLPKAGFSIMLRGMQKAIEITENGFRRVLGFTKPGVWENEIEAEFIHEFIKSRSGGFAYTPIIASGANACVLHYIENERECKDGDLILLDVGACYGNYNADMTRTIPVNGKFSPRQKEVYKAVQAVLNYATDLMRPGIYWVDYQKAVEMFMEEQLIGLGLFTKLDVDNQDPSQPLFKKYFMHGVAHHLGLDVHDVWDKYKPFEAGMVLTCEPGIYIREEGIGIRLENNLLITDGPAINLMANIPIDIEEIESLMS